MNKKEREEKMTDGKMGTERMIRKIVKIKQEVGEKDGKKREEKTQEKEEERK